MARLDQSITLRDEPSIPAGSPDARSAPLNAESRRKEMTVPTVSLVVPVYNTGRYVGRCLQSIHDQSFEDWEVILVDDGSTDESPLVLKQAAESDARVRVVTQENRGVAAARNAGMARASGVWIGFVDSDDRCEPEYLEVLVGQAGPDVDLSMCVHVNEHQAGQIIRSEPGRFTLGPENADRFVDLNAGGGLFGPWAKLFRRETIERAEISFDGSLAKGEDLVFTYQYLRHVDTISVSDYAGYHWVKREGSLTEAWLPDEFENNVRLYETLLEFFNARDLMTPRARDFLNTRFYWHVRAGLAAAHDLDAPLSLRERYRQTRRILSSPHLEGALSAPVAQTIPLRDRWFLENRCAPIASAFMFAYAVRERLGRRLSTAFSVGSSDTEASDDE